MNNLDTRIRQAEEMLNTRNAGITVSPTPPTNPQPGDIWLDMGVVNGVRPSLQTFDEAGPIGQAYITGTAGDDGLNSNQLRAFFEHPESNRSLESYRMQWISYYGASQSYPRSIGESGHPGIFTERGEGLLPYIERENRNRRDYQPLTRERLEELFEEPFANYSNPTEGMTLVQVREFHEAMDKAMKKELGEQEVKEENKSFLDNIITDDSI